MYGLFNTSLGIGIFQVEKGKRTVNVEDYTETQFYETKEDAIAHLELMLTDIKNSEVTEHPRPDMMSIIHIDPWETL